MPRVLLHLLYCLGMLLCLSTGAQGATKKKQGQQLPAVIIHNAEQFNRHLDDIAASFGLPVLARLPIDPSVAFAYDSGLMETVNTDKVADVITAIEAIE